MKQLEIGPGDQPLEGFDTLDMVACPGVTPTFIAEWGTDSLPIPDNSYDLVFASHVIEHIHWTRVLAALQEVHRILKPGGIFECWTQNFAVIVAAYVTNAAPDTWECMGLTKTTMDWCVARLFSYKKHGLSSMLHQSTFDYPHLSEKIREAGFSEVFPLTKSRGHDHGPINLGVGARK